jgi:hypothetical protein
LDLTESLPRAFLTAVKLDIKTIYYKSFGCDVSISLWHRCERRYQGKKRIAVDIAAILLD